LFVALTRRYREGNAGFGCVVMRGKKRNPHCSCCVTGGAVKEGRGKGEVDAVFEVLSSKTEG